MTAPVKYQMTVREHVYGQVTAFLKTDMVQLTFQSYREDRVLHQPVQEPVRVDGVLHRLRHCALLYQLCNLEQNVAVLSQTRMSTALYSQIYWYTVLFCTLQYTAQVDKSRTRALGTSPSCQLFILNCPRELRQLIAEMLIKD